MTGLARETAHIVERLPREKARALLEYARYLAEKVDDEAWQSRFRDRRYVTKLKKMGDQALAENKAGKTTPLFRRGS